MSAGTVIKKRGRPPKDSAVHENTRDTIIKAGVAVLTEKGLSGVGIDEILKLASVPKGSFYHFFENKEKFGIDVIESYSFYFCSKLDRCLLENSIPPLQRLHNFIEDAKSGMAKYDYRRGCLVGNLGQEMGALPESYRKKLQAVFLDWQKRTTVCLCAAQAQGDIPLDMDCEQLSAFFWIGWEGAVLRAKLDRDPQPIDIFVKGFFAALRQ